mgnify:CR=1 FL=1
MKLSLKNKTFFLNKPYHLFEIDNFISNEDYKNLLKSFPSAEYFQGEDGSKAKDMFSSSDEKFNDFLEKNNNWKDFFESFNNDKFLRSAFFSTLNANLKARGMTALKMWTFNKNNVLFFLRPFFRELQVTFMFSRIFKQKSILPHTDIPSKFLSMIYYFPDELWSENEGGNTVFWKSIKNKNKWKNWENRHLKEDEYENFKADHSILHESKYQQNKLVGFVKNDISWHSVDTIRPKLNNVRNTLNIFVRIKVKAIQK